MKLLNFSASICAALTLVSVACSSTTSDIMMGSDQGGSSAGDKPYAGSGNNSAGDRPIGGSSSASTSSRMSARRIAMNRKRT